MVAKTFEITCCLVVSLFINLTVQARKDFPTGMSFYDAQINQSLKILLAPLAEKADLDIKAMKLNIIVDPSYNAFATIDNTFGLHTGFLKQSKTPEEFLGVMAHEFGHVKGRHIARISDTFERIAKQGMIVTGLSAGAVLFAGLLLSKNDAEVSKSSGGNASAQSSAVQAAAGIFLGGISATGRAIAHYSREQENTADHSAIDFLKSLNWPISGFKNSMVTMKELQAFDSNGNVYLRSHPLTDDRISYIDSSLNTDSNPKLPDSFKAIWSVVQIKLKAYLDDPENILQELENDASEVGLIGKAIAYYRMEENEKALLCMDQLIKRFPNNPHYHDLKSDIAWDSGMVEVSRDESRKALYLDKNEPLFKQNYARALIEVQQNLDEATKLLESVVIDNKGFFSAWKYLSQAYGLQNRDGEFNWAQAEYFTLIGKFDLAKEYAKKAENLLDNQSKHYQFLQILKTKLQDVAK